MARKLTRGQIKARMLRALSGLSQEDFERETRVDNIAGIESGLRRPDADQVAQMCSAAGLTPESCETLLQEYEALAHPVQAEDSAPKPERRPSPDPATSIAGIIEDFEAQIGRIDEERSARRAEEREQARDSWERVKGLAFEDVALLARTTREFRNWALVELICGESARALSANAQGSAERARDLAGLAVEIADQVRASAGWCRRLRGFAMAHLAVAQNAAGDPGAARKNFAEAERLWKSGADQDQVLDARRFPVLKASPAARQASG